MHQQQPSHETKLTNGKIGIVHSLQTLVATDANPDLGFLNHAHVVRPVTNGQRHGGRF